MSTRLKTAVAMATATGMSIPYYNHRRLDEAIAVKLRNGIQPPIPQHELDLIARAEAKRDRKADIKAQAKQKANNV